PALVRVRHRPDLIVLSSLPLWEQTVCHDAAGALAPAAFARHRMPSVLPIRRFGPPQRPDPATPPSVRRPACRSQATTRTAVPRDLARREREDSVDANARLAAGGTARPRGRPRRPAPAPASRRAPPPPPRDRPGPRDAHDEGAGAPGQCDAGGRG